MEVFSPDGVCNQKVTYSEHFAATGHSVNLVDYQLILVGQEPEGRSWKYITLHDPRGGLLASKMSISGAMLGGSAPTHHSSFSRGASLYLLGGSQGTQAKYEKGVWNNLNLRWQDGRAFSSFVKGSCSVTLNKDTIMIFGGFTAGTKEVLKSVIAINIIQQTVEERPTLRHARAFHSCEIVGNGRVLVSGGYSLLDDPQISLVRDELYNPTATNSRHGWTQVLPAASSLSRYDHRLVRLGETVFALGGRDGTGDQLTSVRRFDLGTKKWLEHPQDLLSSSTSGMAVTVFPRAAVDCLQDCRSGQGIMMVGGSLS